MVLRVLVQAVVLVTWINLLMLALNWVLSVLWVSVVSWLARKRCHIRLSRRGRGRPQCFLVLRLNDRWPSRSGRECNLSYTDAAGNGQTQCKVLRHQCCKWNLVLPVRHVRGCSPRQRDPHSQRYLVQRARPTACGPAGTTASYNRLGVDPCGCSGASSPC
jgi:hypothetical protein